MTERKFDVNKDLKDMDTALVLDESGILTKKGTLELFNDDASVYELTPEVQEKLMPCVDNYMESAGYFFSQI